MNILDKANKIINERSEEKERQYGPLDKSMEYMRDIFNAATGLDLTAEHMYIAVVATKLARERHAHKEDNLLDAVAYLGGLNNYVEKKGDDKHFMDAVEYMGGFDGPMLFNTESDAILKEAARHRYNYMILQYYRLENWEWLARYYETHFPLCLRQYCWGNNFIFPPPKECIGKEFITNFQEQYFGPYR